MNAGPQTCILQDMPLRMPAASAGPLEWMAGMRHAAHALVRILLGEEVGTAVPERVRRAIAAQQRETEVIIGWVQIGAIGIFAALYWISPKAFPPDVLFEPVPWALAVYAVFTALRLSLAYRDRLTRSFLALSVVVDIGVLILTIWSFHLQYQAPPALSLKAPTLMYVFILIALRALRFEPGYVVLAGVTAAVGWLALLAYAVLAPHEGPMLTHSYAEYATSYRILLGAEIDKALTIIMVTAILALVLQRTRRLLVTAATEGAVARDLSRFFAPEVTAGIRAADRDVALGTGVRRQMAILTTDLRGFTALSIRLPPNRIIALLGSYQAIVVPIIQRHGGSIDKYLGDGILASFGAMAASDTPAANACRALDEIMRETVAWQEARRAAGEPAPAVGAALAFGPAIFGTAGDASRLEYTVTGEVLNLAAKLEKHTKREGVRALTTRASYDAARRQGYRPAQSQEDRSGRQVDGMVGELDLIVLA